MKNLAASREVSSLERKFIILAGPYPSYSFFNLHVKYHNINRCKQRGMDPAFQSAEVKDMDLVTAYGGTDFNDGR